MKKLLFFVLCLTMVLGLASCGTSEDEYYDDSESYQDEQSVADSDVAGDVSDAVSAEGSPDGGDPILDVAAAMQAVIDIVGADAANYYFYDDGDMEVSLLFSGDLAVLVDDEGFDRIDCYCITMYDVERTEDNWYQPNDKYYVPKTTGMVYLFDTDTGNLILKSDAG